MEDNKDFMSIFGSNDVELNFDLPIDEELQETEDTQEETENTDEEITEQEDAEEVGDEDQIDDQSEEDDSDDESSPNLYSSILNVLHEQGIIPSLDSSEKVETSEDLINVFKKEIEIQAARKFEDYIENLDVDKVGQVKKQELLLESISEDTLKDDLELAKQIIYQDYINQGLSEDKAKRLLKKTIDLGEDIVLEDATESLNSLKEFTKRQLEVEKQAAQEEIKKQAEQQKKLELELKNKVYNSQDIVKGLKITKALQDRVYKSMTEIVSKNPETGVLENKLMQERSKDPISFDTRMYYIYELTNGFNDFSKVAKDAQSKTVKDLERVIRRTKIEDNGTPTYLQDPESYGGIGSQLVL